MTALDTPLIRTLSRALDLISQRQSLVSENIANIDTPGYRTRDFDFSRELQRAMQTGSPILRTVAVREVSSPVERPDGNNVSLDRESLLMAHNQLQFQLAVQVLRSEFNRLQLAINGGGNQ